MQTLPAFQTDQLIPLVHAQHPLRRDVIRALQLCDAGQCQWIGKRMVQLVAGIREQQLTEQLVIQMDANTSLILGVLSDGRIGRIRFI